MTTSRPEHDVKRFIFYTQIWLICKRKKQNGRQETVVKNRSRERENMKREQIEELFKGAGVTEDKLKTLIDTVMAENGKDIEKYKAENDTLKAESEQQKTQLTEANKQIESFKGMDVDGIKKAADEWKTKFETAQTEAQKQIDALKLDSALDKALLTAKAKNPKLAKAALNMELIKLDGENILGLNEQLEKLKESDGYLFDVASNDDQNNSSFRMNSGGEHRTGQDAEYDKMSDEEYYKTTLKKE